MATYANGYAKQDGQWWFWFGDGRRVRAREATCKQCGRTFPTYRGATFCSVACRVESTRKAVKAYRCPQCKQRFVPGEKEQRFCSHVCAATAMHAKRIAPTVRKSGSRSALIQKEKAHRFTQDSTGQWWYHFGKKRPCRMRAFTQSCPRCGREFIPTPIKRGDGKPTRHCSRSCGVLAAYDNPELRGKFSGAKSHLWKGGRMVGPRGYVYIHCPGHHSIKYGSRRYVLEHRLVMEEHLKRPLAVNEFVHHKNGIKSDNRIENLELWIHGHPPGQRVSDQKVSE
jgi:hypothetical protein